MHTVSSDPTPARWRPLIALLVLLACCLGVAAIGGAVTATSVATWYPTLAKPPFTPPDAAFGPVWTALYVMMAVAAWLVWRRGGLTLESLGLWLFTGQLLVNLAWPVLFFGMQAIGPALAALVLLVLLAVATTAVFWRWDARAGLLFLPYVAWLVFAAVLNAAIWLLNPA